MLVFGACVIGFSGVLVRLTGTGPAAAGFWRLAFAAPLLAGMARASSGAIGRPSPLALLAGLFFALDLGFWHYGIKYTSVGASTVLSNLTPVVVTVFAWVFLKQRPRALFLLAMAIAVSGAWMMGAGRGGGAPVLNAPLGNLFSVTTALWYALYFLVISQARQTEAATRLMAWSSAAGAPLLLINAMILGEQILPANLAGLAACVGLGVVHTAGQGSIAWAMGWVLFGEALGPLQTVGALVALAGVVLAQWASRPRAPLKP